MTESIAKPDGQHGDGCRVCGRNKMVSPREAQAAYPSYPWGDADLCESADLICSFCKSAFYRYGKRTRNDGTAYWVRVLTTRDRAYKLSQAYNNKSRHECRRKITDGDTTAAEPGDIA